MEDSDYGGDNEDSLLPTSPDFEQQTQGDLNLRLLPESKEKYLATYKKFMAWREEKDEPISEDTLLIYFTELSTKLGATSLWSVYSMLKSVIRVNDNIDISTYKELTAFIKRQSDGYRPKKASAFNDEQIQKFLTVAANSEFLVAKVSISIEFNADS